MKLKPTQREQINHGAIMNIQELATHYLNQFTRKTREDGSQFYSVEHREENEQLLDLCYRAHDGMLPDDWRYQFIVESLEYIAEYGDDLDIDDCVMPDEALPDLLNWLGSHMQRVDDCDLAAAEYELAVGTGIVQRIQRGQMRERWEVLGIVLEVLRKQTENA